MWSRQGRASHSPVHDERSSGPQGLDELASRLHREAKRLADRYPASPQIIQPRVANGRVRSRVSLAAMATVAALLVAVASPMLFDGRLRHREPDRLVSRFSSTQERSEVSNNGRTQVPPASELASSPTPAAGPSVESTVEVEAASFLLDVSDPELEALLDLFEEGRSEPTRLSI